VHGYEVFEGSWLLAPLASTLLERTASTPISRARLSGAVLCERLWRHRSWYLSLQDVLCRQRRRIANGDMLA